MVSKKKIYLLLKTYNNNNNNLCVQVLIQTKGLIHNKFYGSSTDDPARGRSARALARIKVRLSLPYNRQVAWDLEQFPLVARREARRDKVCMASAPQHP